MNSIEHQIQKRLIEACRQIEPSFPELRSLYAIPNGGHRNIIVARKLKAEGVRAGVPDLCLPISDGIFNALYIEMKRPGGSVSKEQRMMHAELERWGNHVIVCFSAQTALDALVRYIRRSRHACGRQNNARD